MKRLLITSFAILTILTSHAQLSVGTRLIEGTFSAGGNSRTDEFNLFGGINDFEFRNNFLTVAPRIGWFTGNNTIAGLGFNYQHNTNKNFNGGGQPPFITRRNLYSLNFFYTKYNPLVDKLYLTTTVNFLVGLGNENGEFNNEEQESNLFQAALNVVPGLTYFISEKWALQATIGQLFYQYQQSKWKIDIPDEPKNTSSNYGLSFSANTFTVGFQYFLARKGD